MAFSGVESSHFFSISPLGGAKLASFAPNGFFFKYPTWGLGGILVLLFSPLVFEV